MEYDLLSPVTITKKGSVKFQASFEVRKHTPFTLNQLSFPIKKMINVLYESIPNGQYSALVPNFKPITKQIAEKFVNFQTIIGHCINNGEFVNNKLREFLLSISEIERTKDELLSLDFMKLRDLFSEFLKKYKPFQDSNNFKTRQQQSAFTKLMFKFITDRNIYTHGMLWVFMPEENYIIDYIDKKKGKQRAKITLEYYSPFLILLLCLF
jgi:hypothetical protein